MIRRRLNVLSSGKSLASLVGAAELAAIGRPGTGLARSWPRPGCVAGLPAEGGICGLLGRLRELAAQGQVAWPQSSHLASRQDHATEVRP